MTDEVTTTIRYDEDEDSEKDKMPEGLEGLEADLFQNCKFRIIMYENVLHTEEILKKGFFIDRNFIKNVFIDEVLFSLLPIATKRRNKLRTHEDLIKIYPDTEEGKQKKEKERGEAFDKFIRDNTLGSKSSADDQEMFDDIFELTKKAWKKEGGFSSEDFYRFAKIRASDPELVKIYKVWFENIFSSAALLAWEAIKLRKNPAVFEIAAPKKEDEGEKAAKKQEKTFLSTKGKLAAIGMTATMLILLVFYFSIKALFMEEEKVSELGDEQIYEHVSFPHLCGKKWAHNQQNDIMLLADEKIFKKKYDIEEPEKKVYYPAIQGQFEAYLNFKDRVHKHQQILEKCGYKVVFIKGIEAALLEKESKYMEILEKCSG